MPAPAPLIRVRELSLTHAGASDPAPREVRIDLRPGEVVLLLGPSGSGKSTLTLALNGLIPHSVDATVEGSVEVAGRDTVETPVAALSGTVSMVFQDPDAQLVTGTVLDEVAFALENLRLPVDEVLARAEAALRRTGLWHRRAENPDHLSGGGRQRLAIACALATASPVMVLDEPTANLDPAGADDVFDALAQIAADPERTLVLVEHDLDRAVQIATRVLVLDRMGSLVFDGTPEGVLRDHAEDLIAMGVWLPRSTLLARRLRERGIAVDRLPLTPEELHATLAAHGPLPATVPPSAEPPAPSRVDTDASRGDTDAPPAGPTARPAGVAASPGAADPIIHARGLSVSRGRTPILRDIDLDIAAGTLTAIVGPNGAGKTTLAQALAGVVPPPRRTVTVAGLDPATASPRELIGRVGFVFQNPEHQFIAATVFDELAHGLRLRGVPDDEVRRRVDEMLTRFGLAHKADVHPFLLSGGEKRRLSVGTALIARPDVVVLDEPTFGQDHARAQELLALLHDLRRGGTTVILVSHDMQLVAEHATHVVVVEEGKVRASGPTARVLFAALPLVSLPPALQAVPEHLRPLLAEERERNASSRDAVPPPGSHPRTHPSEASAPGTAEPEAATPQTAEHSATAPDATAPAGDRPAADPFAAHAAAPGHAYLHTINPLAKLGGVVPAMALLVFVRDLATPLAFLALAYALLLTGARLTRRTLTILLLAVPAGMLVIALAFAVWVDPALVADTDGLLRIGPWTLYTGALGIGAATGLRLGAILALGLVSGLTTTGPDLVRAGVQQLRIPYRIGYTALAAYRFVPRFGYELSVIRAAHRVRGHHGGRGPLARIARGWGYIVPLLASGIRHAERVALAMDARAFGAFPTRTERYLVPFRRRDAVFLALLLAASAALFTATFPWGL